MLDMIQIADKIASCRDSGFLDVLSHFQEAGIDTEARIRES